MPVMRLFAFVCWRSRRISCALLALVAALCSGCGVTEYEQKMAAEQARLQYFDEETKYLDEPINLPRKPVEPGKNATDLPIFFRPPKGIPASTNPKDPLLGDVFYRFQGKSGFFQEMYVMASTDTKDFIRNVQRPYPEVDFATGTEVKVNPKYRDDESSKYHGKPLTFMRYETKEPKRSFIYVLRNEPAGAVAIVFVVNPQGSTVTKGNMEEAIKYSLSTLAIGPEMGGPNGPKAKYTAMKARAKA